MALAIIVIDEDASDEAIAQFKENLKPGISEAIRNVSKSPTGKLADSISIQEEGLRVIRVVSSAPYADEVDSGSRPRTMWNLINRVVPLKLSGTTIFRKVTLKSILEGKWHYPGTPGKAFVEKGADLARKKMDRPISFRIVKPPLTVIDVG
jgi:hypothetical protein